MSNRAEELTSSGGWICSECGEFVPNNTTHSCRAEDGASAADYTITLNPADQEVVTLLRKIANDLSAIKQHIVGNWR